MHKVIPDRILGNGSAGFRRSFDDGGEVAPAAVFHEDVEDAGVPVDEAVVVPHYVFVMEVFEDVTMRVFATSAEQPGTRERCGSVSVRKLEIGGGHDAHFGDDELLVAL